MDTAQAKMFVCSLNNSAAKILVAFVLARSALDVQELREWTGMKRETIYDGLRTLKGRGMLEKQTLAHGRAVWLPAGDFLPGFFQMSEKGTPDPQMSGFRTPALVVVDSLNLTDSESTSSTSVQMSEKGTPDPLEGNREYPSVKEILAATYILFGQPGVVSSGLDLAALQPWTVLGWIGYAWDNWRDGGRHGNLFAPAGVIYNKLADLDKPHAPGGFHEGGWRELPSKFLEHLKLVEYGCDECDQVFDKQLDLEAHVRSAHAVEEPAEEVLELVAWIPDDSVTAEIETAWGSVLQLLQFEMPRASFETWARDTKVIRYDGNALSIGTRNAYAQDWLASHLTSKVERLLNEILDQPVTVEFVVMQ